MSRRPATALSSIELMCEDFRKTTTLSPTTIRDYSGTLKTLVRIFEEGKRHTMPWEITKEDVIWLLDYYKKHNYAINTRKTYTSVLKTWVAYYDNNSINDLRTKWPTDMRPNADWLTYDQAIALLKLEKVPMDDLIVHCELCLGMRRIEVLRLHCNSFYDTGGQNWQGCFVDILGKGSQGGKPRRVPYHRNTRAVLERYMEYRKMLVMFVKSKNKNVEVPDSLLIYASGKKLKAYSQVKCSGIDERIKPLGEAIGYPDLSNHTLRRTFGRTLYRDHVEPATISKLLGHNSIDETLKYIGVDLDDMTSAMSAFTL